MRRQTAGRSTVFVLLLLALGFGTLAWRHPLWLVDRQIEARLRLHGVHSEYVTVNGYKMHYLVGGSGRPLVLVHGLGSRGADWANLIPQFIDGGHRVYALDLLGYGLSSQPRDAQLLHRRPGVHGRRFSRQPASAASGSGGLVDGWMDRDAGGAAAAGAYPAVGAAG